MAAVFLFGAWLFLKPSNEREWIVGQKVLPSADFQGDDVTVHNVRNFTYAADGTATERYETRKYDLDKIQTAWFILAPFSAERRGAAHTFLSFGFADSQYVAISVEARREVGEDYSILQGMMRKYEIMYVIGDERDLIGLRANIRNDQVYVYPIKATKEAIRELFVQMLNRANELREKPEFYNTLTNNCTTNILHHANQISPKKIPYGKEVLLPGYADELAEHLGLLDTDLDIAHARERFLVNARAKKYAADPNFSVKIRQAE